MTVQSKPARVLLKEMEREKAEGLLERMLGPGAKFRDGQWEAIDLVANRRRRLLVVQRTGWGKSVVYFLAARILRDAGTGPALLISPLLALMRNQLLAAEKLGIRARAIHSENQEEWTQVEAGLHANEIDLLMVSPERLGNPEFLKKLLPLVQGSIGMFVVDEAHCISDWGHDFRPDYRRIVRILRLLPPGAPVLCTTATANDRVVRDIQAQISQMEISRGPLVRPSLRLFNIKLHGQAERLAWLAHFLPQLPGSGIIYTLTIQDARRVADWLKHRDVKARAYHADLDAAERVEAEQQLLSNELKALVSTVALGMGFDKSDLGFVIHFQRPGSVVAYYQQVGRAGRAVDTAFGILLSGVEDDEIQNFFIASAFPPAQVMLGVLAELEKGGAMTIGRLGARLNYGRGVIEKALKLLEVDGAVEHDRSGYSRTANPWQPDVERYERVTQNRRTELEEIKRYVEHPGCLMEFLARSLDDPHAAPCGKCMNCTGNTTRRVPPAALAQEAVNFLCNDTLLLEPRIYWPTSSLDKILSAHPGIVQMSKKGTLTSGIPIPFRSQSGRILCLWGDAGWGTEVARGKYEAGDFSDLLVEAAASLIRGQWKPAPAPEWVAAVPSLHRPELVQHFARRLAAKLELPYHAILRKTRATRPQKEMQNSAQQIHNLLGAFDVHPPVPRGPVLLVDDVVDSGWTLALLAVLLQQHGSGPVHPFALAKASPRGS